MCAIHGPDINLNWLQLTSNTAASVSIGLVSTEASIFTLVVHTIIRVYLTPGVNLVLLFKRNSWFANVYLSPSHPRAHVQNTFSGFASITNW